MSFPDCHLSFFLSTTIMRRLSSDETARILSLLQEGQSLRDVAHATGRSIFTISKLCQEHLPDQSKSSGGRPPKLSPVTIHHTTRLITSGKVDTATAAAKHLHTTSTETFSDQTLHRRLKGIELRSGVKAKHPLLTTRHCKARLDFAQAHKDWTEEDWKRVV